ncbi:hypothetical protein BCR44DRAFT_1487015 [Catenaria anguillulae PL171]|uniref:Uncharacterized protein n=1 Tax=Catenaria anguillulae PL171 TaxID=765915 RepID=A0A1Y2HDL5_9FUNG|nr:hypothetical protein BCR44DRAFT_1487015 [Catenaria anguillulae PL171]
MFGIPRPMCGGMIRFSDSRMLDAARWDKVCSSEDKAARLLAVKQARSKMCSSSVSYDVLTTGYAKGKRGESLKQKDAQEARKAPTSFKFLSSKLNTYNPIQGKDLLPLSDEDNMLMPRNSVRRCK